MSQQHRENKIGTPLKSEAETFPQWFQRVEGRKLTKTEEEFLRQVEDYQRKHEKGKDLSHQQKHLALHQARQIGDL